MSVSKELMLIKKHYGEDMMRFCRDNFATILENKGLLLSTLEKTFDPNHYVYMDMKNEGMLENFKSYIFSKLDISERYVKTDKSPEELMEEAGYILFPECKSEEEIQAFRKYWRKDEELCTFKGNRLDTCRVWFAIKKNIDEIKRKEDPSRQDDYGVSAISIQFSKGENMTLSIKNRYNHTVSNPDATFSNNLENIISGLTMAFYQKYNVKDEAYENRIFEIPRYIESNGIYYRCNLIKHGIYYCSNNKIIVGNRIDTLDKNTCLLVDNFVIDFQNKDIASFDDDGNSFIESIGEFTNIEVINKNGNKEIIFKSKDKKDVVITLDEYGGMKKYYNENVISVGDYFLNNNRNLKEIELPNLIKCGSIFLSNASGIKVVSTPKLEECGNGFLGGCKNIKTLALNNLIKCGDDFLYEINLNKTLNLPSLKECADRFMTKVDIKQINLPSLEKCGNFFMPKASVKKISADNLKCCGSKFLFEASVSDAILLPGLKECGNEFMFNCDNKSVELASLKECGSRFIISSRIGDVSLPSLEKCGTHFMVNSRIKSLFAPKLKECGDSFMVNCNIKENNSLKNR